MNIQASGRGNFVLVLCLSLCLFSTSAKALCRYVIPDSFLFCDYFVDTIDQARDLCALKALELNSLGYVASCDGSANRTSGGWFGEDMDGNAIRPWRMIRVQFDIDCHGLVDVETGSCAPIKDYGDGCGVGNPCNPATGNKYQTEIDFSIQGLSFVRSYNSQSLVDIGMGKGWRNIYQKQLVLSFNALTRVTGAGRGEPWYRVNDSWVGEADSNVNIIEHDSGFQLMNEDGSIENYAVNGKIISELDAEGYTTTYAYNDNFELINLSNHYGSEFNFAYEDEHLISVTDSFGVAYFYEYSDDNNLVSVIYPDSTLNDDTDNPRKIYHYENPDYPNHLTGITDENGNRYATYAYDVNGKAISTEHAQTTNPVGQEKFELDYQGAN